MTILVLSWQHPSARTFRSRRRDHFTLVPAKADARGGGRGADLRTGSGGAIFSSHPVIVRPAASRSSRKFGAQNLSKVNIAEAIEKARTKRAERLELTGDMVVDERARSALVGSKLW
jgi:hypothetical protein